MLLDVQHVEFGPQFSAFGVGADGEFSQTGFKLQAGVGDNQMTPDSLSGGRLPGQQAQAKHQFVFLAKAELLLMNGKERGIDLVEFLPRIMFFRPLQPFVFDILIPCPLNLWMILKAFRVRDSFRLVRFLAPVGIRDLSGDFR